MTSHRGIHRSVRPLFQFILLCIIALGGTLASVQTARADTYTVTNVNDNGSGSLRDAIDQANANPGPDTITFGGGATGTILLESNLPPIEEALTITGPGAATLAISGDDQYRIFTINPGVAVTISGLTLHNGYDAFSGGAIYSDGDLTLVDSTLRDNFAPSSGGAIYVNEANLTMQSSLLQANRTDGSGGAVHMSSSTASSLTLDAVDIISNTSGYEGGGIYLYTGGGANVTIENSEIYSNVAYYNGGALSVVHYQNSSINLTDSVLRDNWAQTGYGGALSIANQDNETNTVVNLTGTPVHHNTSYYDGGGIYVYAWNSTVDFSTDREIHDNEATNGSGGGVHITGLDGTASLPGVDVYDNYAGNHGGGLYLAGSELDANGSAFFGNQTGFGAGGAVYLTSNSTLAVALNEVEIYGNTSASDGGGIYLSGQEDIDVAIIGTTIYSNTSQSSGGGVSFSTNAGATVTISGTEIYSNVAYASAGGLWLSHLQDGALTVTNSILRDNRADNGYGGALTVLNYDSGAQATVNLFGTPVHHNTAYYDGGGIYVYAPSGTANFSTDREIHDNEALYGGGGGAYVSGFDGTVSLPGVDIYDNYAGSHGGGLFISGSTLDAEGSAYYRNEAGGSGGALYLASSAALTVTLDAMEIYSNTSVTSGGGIHLSSQEEADVVVIGTTIYSNTSQGSGGGIYLFANTGATVAITGTEVYSNVALVSGGGLWLNHYQDGALTVTNSVLRDNRADNSYGGALSVENYDSGTQITVSLIGTPIHNNVSAAEGGGIYIYVPSGTANFSTDQEIHDNQALFGGGGGVYISSLDGTVSLPGVDIYDNRAGSNGGGLFISGSTLDAEGSAYYRNEAGGSGGAIYLASNSTLAVALSAMEIYSNTSFGSGGGAYFSANEGATVAITGTLIYSNVALSSGGGGLWLNHYQDGTVTFTNSLLRDNRADNSYGGALYVQNSDSGRTTAITLTATPLQDNSATYGGGGIYLYNYGGPAYFTSDSDMVRNQSVSGAGGALSMYGFPSLAIVSDATIEDNFAGGAGGALQITGSELTATNVTFARNVSHSSGGAFSLTGGGSVTATLDAVAVISNTASSDGGGIHLSASEDSLLTVTDSTFISNTTEFGNGGGIFVNGGRDSYVSVSTTQVHTNTADNSGGGIYVWHNRAGELTVESSSVQRNRSRNNTGGGIFFDDGYPSEPSDSTVTLLDTIVQDNEAGWYGGGVYLYGDNGKMRFFADGILAGNHADSSGGGFYVYAAENYLDLDGAEVYGNDSTSNGGGLAIEGNKSTITLTATSLYSNTTANSGHGGGLYLGTTEQTTLTVSTSEISGNVADGDGGGIYFGDYWWATSELSATIRQSTLADNEAGSLGGAIYLADSRLRILESALRNNRAEYGGAVMVGVNGEVDILDSEISGNSADISGGGVYVQYDSSAWITGTHILTNTGTTQGAGLMQDNGGSLQVTDSCIVSNEDIAVFNLGGSDLIATDNWWGVRNGPGGQGPGLGDSVSSVVDFSDFKTAAPEGCPDISPILRIVKSVEGIPAPGDRVTYTLVAGNSGLTTDPGVTVSDALPPQVDFAQWIEQPSGAQIAGDNLLWQGALEATDEITFTFAVDYVGDHSEVVTNTADLFATLENTTTQVAFTAKHLFTVDRDGSGSGMVASEGGEIDCGSECTAELDPGSVITLTATPADDSDFVGWSGACTGTDDCVVTLDASKLVTATFDLKTHLLSVATNGAGTITSDPAGIDCGIDCDQLYLHGTQVTLTAIADGDSFFIGWSGDCTGTGDCVVEMTAPHNVTATFAALVNLHVDTDGNGSGSVTSDPAGIDCGVDCDQLFLNGTQVTLTATPDATSDFTGWSGACTGTAECVVTLDAAKTVTATFTLKSYLLDVTLAGNGSGSVTSDPTGIDCGTDCDESYLHGAEVTLVATPESNSDFAGWSGDCTGTDECVVTMDAAKNVIATFTLKTYSLTVSKAGNGTGTVELDPPGVECDSACTSITETYTHGTQVTLTASADLSSDFVEWSGACTGSGQCVVTMDAAKNVTANFALKSMALTVAKEGSGTGSVTSTPAGIDCGGTCSHSFDYGTEVTLVATPDASSDFAGWSGDCTGTDECVVTMDAVKNVTATFSLKSFVLTVTKIGDGTGTVHLDPPNITCDSACTTISETYQYGTVITLTATPDGVQLFGGWGGACLSAGENSQCVLTINGTTNVQVGFNLFTYPLSVSHTGSGSGSVASTDGLIDCGSDCSENYEPGTVVTLTATPNFDSDFAGWGGPCAGTGDCVVTMSAARNVSAQFNLKTFSLNTTLAGNGSGVVFNNPTGTNCGTYCDVYSYGTEVTLTATPNSDSTFDGWSGDCTGTDTCVVTMDAPHSVTATFTIKTYALSVNKSGNGSGSVSSDPAGIDCGGDCSETYTHGTVVTLTATADTGSIFIGWSGGECAGTGTCVVTMDAVKDIAATFLLRHALNVSRDGNGSGSVISDPAGIDCGSDCSETYTHGTVVTLTATADIGSVFTGWSGDCTGSVVGCVLTMDAAKNAVATFSIQTHTLTVAKSGTGGGLVTSDPAGIDCGSDCSETYSYSTVVTLTAVADGTSTFDGWSGACSGTGQCVVTMDAARNVTASFTRFTYNLTVNRSGSGSGSVSSNPAGITCGGDCSQSYDHGTEVTLTAAPAANSDFVGWSGACSGTGQCVVTMTEAKSVTAEFSLKIHTLTVAVTGSGSVTSNPPGIDCGSDCSESYTHGTQVTLTPAPAADSNFAGWSGACSGTGQCVVTMDAARNVTANFALQTFELTVSKTGNGDGTITSNPAGINCGTDCSENYTVNTEVTLTAAPAANSNFTGWSGACSGTGQCVVTMSEAKAVSANFVAVSQTPSLTVLLDGNGSGRVISVADDVIDCPTTCSADFSTPEEVFLAAVADAGSEFVGWSGACGGSGICRLSMSEPRTVTAHFAPNTSQHNLTVLIGSGSGTVTSDPAGIDCGTECVATYLHNTRVTLVATPAFGASFSSWGGACAANENIPTCTVGIREATEVVAYFTTPPTFSLELFKSGNGTVHIEPSGFECGVDCSFHYQAFPYGTVVTLTAVADQGMPFAGWFGACTGSDTTCVLTIDYAHYVTAVFGEPYTLDVVKVGGGTVYIYDNNPLGVCGSDCSRTYPPTGGYAYLVAEPDNGMTFLGWSGACTHTASWCSIYIATDQVVTATFGIPGSIAGTVSVTGTQPANVTISAQRPDGSVARSVTIPVPAAGFNTYTLAGLPPGNYRIRFTDSLGNYASEYFDNVRVRDTAASVSVSSGQTTRGINALLSPIVRPPNVFQPNGNGTVIWDADLEQYIVSFPWANRSDLKVSSPHACSTGRPTNVRLFLGSISFPMIETPAGSNTFEVTVPAAEIVPGDLRIEWDCPNPNNNGTTRHSEPAGQIVLYDPSGIVSDAVTGEPIQGARVTLHYVPGWLPDTADEVRQCRTIDTRSGPTWASEPDGALDLGVPMDMVADAQRMSPVLNPQITNEDGYYGWDVSEGCYYVVVAADGYLTRVSPVVGVPPEVLDLDLTLTPIPSLTIEKAGNGSGIVTSEPDGLLCGEFCSDYFPVGTEIVLSATPDEGSIFTGWSGACTGTGTCTITLEEAATVTATFALDDTNVPMLEIFLPWASR